MSARPESPRGSGLSRRLALWTSAAALLGIACFAVASYGLLTVEANEWDAAGEEAEDDAAFELGEELLWAMLLAGPPSVGVAVAAAVWATRRALAPLRAVTRAATEVTTADLGRRLSIDDADRDLRELVVAFNDLLARLDRGVDALDRYAADVSHEVRTPLAVAITELEVAVQQHRSVEQWEIQARRTVEDLHALARLADALLGLARSTSAAGIPRERVALAEALAPELERAAATARERDIALEVSLPRGPAATVRGAAPLLRGAVANVLDNALRHARRPGRVSVRIHARDTTVHVLVEDDGPGIPASDREAVLRPFVRGTEGEGYGLGLALAHRTIEAHGGTIEIGASALGGAAVAIALPAATRDS